jgi:meso-butanediol dehydrogenase/(S,S)-butanediol dehydrogenase/diacetyl reductase
LSVAGFLGHGVRFTRSEVDVAPVELLEPGGVAVGDELTVAVNSFAGSNDGLDVMMNNAGIATAGSLMDVALEDWRAAIDTNLMGVIHGCRAAIPHLQRNRAGLLINVASAAAFGPRGVERRASRR